MTKNDALFWRFTLLWGSGNWHANAYKFFTNTCEGFTWFHCLNRALWAKQIFGAVWKILKKWLFWVPDSAESGQIREFGEKKSLLHGSKNKIFSKEVDFWFWGLILFLNVFLNVYDCNDVRNTQGAHWRGSGVIWTFKLIFSVFDRSERNQSFWMFKSILIHAE